jgi:hypothetical protein
MKSGMGEDLSAMPLVSYVVRAPAEESFPELLVMLDRGVNVFNALVPDLGAFAEELRARGVEILEANVLDEEPEAQFESREAMLEGLQRGEHGPYMLPALEDV